MRRLQEEKVFKDPVHRYIYVQEPLIWNLINTREFQRLRRIRQLGTSYLTFHGAEHSRFSHSMGVYEITRKIISQFERSKYEDWPTEEKLVCLCAALLHDLGHGPFSHSIESVMGVRHEEWSCKLILGDTDVHRELAAVSEEMPNQVADVITGRYEPSITVSLISSQLDADRMDYLLRDAYYTGVHYGTFDMERILRVMRPHRDQIVIKESGMHAVEDYLMSRYQMYWQVYFHPVTRGSEILLRKILERVSWLYKQGFSFTFMLDPLPKLIENTLTEADYQKLDESFLQLAFSEWVKEDDWILSDLCDRFLNRRLFKYITIKPEDEVDMLGIREYIHSKGLDPDYYVELDTLSDLPYDVYRPGVPGKLPILLRSEDGVFTEISTVSPIIQSICGTQFGMKHIYFPDDLVPISKSELKHFVVEQMSF